MFHHHPMNWYAASEHVCLVFAPAASHPLLASMTRMRR